MKKIELSIPKPCHENWTAMTPEDKGRFCGACQKTVMDFTAMSDREIAQFFKKPIGSVCGRFGSDQLNKIIDVPRKRIPWLKYFFTISLPAFLFSMKAGAQGEVRVKEKVTVNVKPVKGDTVVLPVQNPVELHAIKGRVVNEKGEPISASIKFKGTQYGVVADEDGRFELKNFKNYKEIIVSSIGYESQIITLSDLATVTIVLPALTHRELMMGIVVNTVKRKSPVIPVIQPKKMDTAFSKFSIFPNPVSSNSSFTIDVKHMEDGRYEMSILTSTGELIQTKELLVEKEVKLQTVQLNTITAGPYFIRLTNKYSKKSYTEIIIVK